MRKFWILLALLGLLSVPVLAQDHPKAEVFGGYSFASLNTGATTAANQRRNLNGWNVAVAGNVTSWFSIVGDFAGYYGTPDLGDPISGPAPVRMRHYTFMGGPQINVRAFGRVTPFARVLLGATRARSEALDPATGSVIDSATQDAFTMALGGGIDFAVNRHVAIRVVQADYLFSRFPTITFNVTDPEFPFPFIQGASQHSVRVSAGLVIRFGGR